MPSGGFINGGGGGFVESDHPRDAKGEFTGKGGSSDASTSGPAADNSHQKEGSQEKQKPRSGVKNSGSGASAKATPARVTATVDASPSTRAQAREYFGREVSDADFQRLLGAPEGSTIAVDRHPSGGLIFHVDHDELFEQQQRAYCLKKADGTPFMLLDLYHLKKGAPGGTGLRAFSQMVAQGRAMGLDAIVIPEAARTSRMVGYWVWPRFGADGDIPDNKVAELPKSLKSCEKLSDLMKTQEGRDWWLDKGETVFCFFKLDPSSSNSQVLRDYQDEKGFRE